MTSGILVLILRILTAVLLYGFITWALLTIWRELRTQGQRLSAPRIPSLLITRLDGAEETPRTYANPEVIIGRSANSDYPIIDETVSARHTRLSYHHNQWWVEDMKSRNGTFLNDERINVPTVIIPGDELRCGQVGLVIGIEETN
jgi:pSer/pThr/pTyr-binding forkhead associated (FHA) protein